MTPRSGRPIASAPLRVALSSSRVGASSGASACSAASSLNRFRSDALARLSVPMATRAPDAKKRAAGGLPTPTQRLLRGQVTIVARADQAQHVGRDRIGRMRHDVRGDTRRPVRLDVLRRGVEQRGRIGRIEADDLAEDDAVQAAPRQRLLAGGGVGDVADGGGASLERVDDRLAHRRRIVAAAGEALRHQRRHPRRQRRRRRHLAPQPRQLQVRVRVDQAGQEDAVSEVARLDAGSVGRTAGPERDDAAAGNGDPPVAQRRCGDREHPGGAQAGGHRHGAPEAPNG
jgi:hypothetical protein